jgi:hypothetical protein
LEKIHKIPNKSWPNPVNEDPEYLAEWLAFELGDRSNLLLYQQAAWFVLKETLRVLVVETQKEIEQIENDKSRSLIFKDKLEAIVDGDWDNFVEKRIGMR